MFIQTEQTPNPLTLKFIPGVPVMTSGTLFLTNGKDAGNSPLALELFRIEGVTAVFFGSDFITVTRSPEQSWDIMKPALLAAIMDHFVAGKPVVITTETAATEETGEDSEIVAQIKELIEMRVRPAVAQDGGDIIFRGFHDGIVQLELHGSCAGCPSSTMTLKNGIENMLKHYVPEVVAVEAVM
jgi:Fe-S cluster biogenesis protein NfuA